MVFSLLFATWFLLGAAYNTEASKTHANRAEIAIPGADVLVNSKFAILKGRKASNKIEIFVLPSPCSLPFFSSHVFPNLEI